MFAAIFGILSLTLSPWLFIWQKEANKPAGHIIVSNHRCLCRLASLNADTLQTHFFYERGKETRWVWSIPHMAARNTRVVVGTLLALTVKKRKEIKQRWTFGLLKEHVLFFLGDYIYTYILCRRSAVMGWFNIFTVSNKKYNYRILISH